MHFQSIKNGSDGVTSWTPINSQYTGATITSFEADVIGSST